MDFTTLMLGVLFGALGFGFFLYGKNTANFLIIGVGLALMILPYFISNVPVLVIVCAGLTALPWVFRNRF